MIDERQFNIMQLMASEKNKNTWALIWMLNAIKYMIHQLTRNLEEWLLRTNKIAFHQSH